MSMKNSNDIIWNRTSDVPNCIAQHFNHCTTAVPAVMWLFNFYLTPANRSEARRRKVVESVV